MAKPPLTPGRIARLRENPGTRAALDSKFLTPAQQVQRRLHDPIAPGSSMTRLDLARQRKAAQTVQFGPAETALGQQLAGQQQQGRDQQSWYDQYVNDLRTHAQNVSGNNQTAQQALTQLTGNVGKLTSDVQGTGAQQDAEKASAIRQALTASFGAQQVATGRASNDYADTLANVVAPGQRLTALAQSGRNQDAIRQKQTDLATQKGAAGQKFDADAVANEIKNVLAGQALGLDAAKADTTAAAGRSTRREQRRHNQAQETAAANDPSKQKTQAELDYFDKHGYWPPTGPPKPAKGGKSGSPDWLTQNEMSTGLAELPELKGWASKAKAGQPFVAGHKPEKRLSRREAAQKLTNHVQAPKDPILLTATLDAVYDGHLSPETVRRLINAGYKPSRVAQTLGVPTAGQYRSRTAGQVADQAIREVSGALRGVGGR